MADFLQKLPTVLVLAVLVAIFVSLQRHNRSARVRLWIVAWGLIFLHFFVQLFEPGSGMRGLIASAIDIGALSLSAVVFTVSMTLAADLRRVRYALMTLLGVPVLVYTTAATFDVSSRWIYLACLAVFYGGGLAWFAVRNRRFDFLAWLFVAAVTGMGAWGIYAVWKHSVDTGLTTILGIGFAIPAYFFWRRYPRWTPGVVTTVGGFITWGLVFPVGDLVDLLAPKLPIPGEMWNVPKFFVAFGMILTLLEEKSHAAEQAGAREHALNMQMQRFADITSRLLRGVDVRQFCQQVAQTITEASNFQRAAIVLADDHRQAQLAGSCGVTDEIRSQIECNLKSFAMENLTDLCANAVKIGQSSYLFHYEQLKEFNPVRSLQQFDPNPNWTNGDEMIVPLLSPQGRYIGFISLDDPRDVSRVTPEEMSKVELLAADLAMALENSTLQRQLTRSEKLASIGQLVAGVAHELNNPLTAVLGYSELLLDEVEGDAVRRRIDSLSREAQRMKRIIQNLLRFARQNKPERKPMDLAPLIRDVIALREYHLVSAKIETELVIEPKLPRVSVDEDQMKQVLLNLLNNAIDAVEEAPEKRISISAIARRDRVLLQVIDSGPGFADLDRAFDPFFTTKPVGRGTGLGLSICYGILKDHGGEIQVHNQQPNGARIVVELPVADVGASHTAVAAGRS